MSKWYLVWQREYGRLSLYIEIEILLQNYFFYNDCLDSCWSIVDKKWNDMPSQKDLSSYYSYNHNKSSKYVLLS